MWSLAEFAKVPLKRLPAQGDTVGVRDCDFHVHEGFTSI